MATVTEMCAFATKFEGRAGFPDVIGSIDGTYIQIHTPHVH